MKNLERWGSWSVIGIILVFQKVWTTKTEWSWSFEVFVNDLQVLDCSGGEEIVKLKVELAARWLVAYWVLSNNLVIVQLEEIGGWGKADICLRFDVFELWSFEDARRLFMRVFAERRIFRSKWRRDRIFGCGLGGWSVTLSCRVAGTQHYVLLDAAWVEKRSRRSWDMIQSSVFSCDLLAKWRSSIAEEEDLLFRKVHYVEVFGVELRSYGLSNLA